MCSCVARCRGGSPRQSPGSPSSLGLRALDKCPHRWGVALSRARPSRVHARPPIRRGSRTLIAFCDACALSGSRPAECIVEPSIACPSVVMLPTHGKRSTSSAVSASYRLVMSTTYSEAVESVEQLVEALTEARRALRATEVALRRALKKVDQGGTVANALVAAQPADSRQTVNDALTVVEQCRHEARRRVFAAALDEGMTIGALGRAWGFSRQMAARYAKEARSAA